MNDLFRAGLAVCTALFLAVTAQAQVGADLNLSPKRVVLGQADRTATVYVYNRGTKAASYSIDLVDRVMTPDGNIRAVADLTNDTAATPFAAKLKSAKPMLVFTPRRVTLEPGESQTVRIRALRPADLANGEYRTTLTVTAIPPEDVGLTAEQAVSGKANEISMRVTALFSLSIPVVVRQGEYEVSARVLGARMTGSGIAATVARSGANSLYGTLEARRGSDSGEMIGFVKGLGIYTEVDSRETAIPLQSSPKSGEKIVVLFRDDDQKPGAVLASELLVVP